jgi:holo-[acyl-carrier protein] synthase
VADGEGDEGTMAQRVRVGTDITAIPDVIASIERFGDRYLDRLFTEHERASCAGPPEVAAAGLAARFAAKEAVVKVLRPAGARPAWRSIEVRRAPSGACDLALTGEAARLASEAGVTDLGVSLTHEGNIAVAVVVALHDDPPPCG